MLIQDMFQKDINRDINGVIKVTREDESDLLQELEEYIVTRELKDCFSAFFENYSRALDVPTDKIGVWISGFFGSGKSHFLKILSSLLSGKMVAGRRALEYLSGKFTDPALLAQARRCASVPTESILFNMDVEGPSPKDRTAVLRIFATVFYNHLGFFGRNLKTARLERFIEASGKTAQFRAAFEEIRGMPWLTSRDTFEFFEDDVAAALQRVLGMSETAARNWFNGAEAEAMSVGSLADEIREYVDSKGDDFRLLFCADEVGQYIGDDGDLMINLQSIVEELGGRCRGKVWVMVTSQEAIDSVVKVTGDDFSKIQGRFDTRLSLSSASVDEVIKKRILEKTPDAAMLLGMIHDTQHAVLRNLFTFTGTARDIRGYSDADEFAAAYPFVPYQFILIQKVFSEIRLHGNSGKHLSGGERSMLSGFQEAAQRLQDRDEHALVPFHLFYHTVQGFLERPIRQVIDRCQRASDRHEGLEPQDADVLRLLYLIRYIKDISATTENITVLMTDDIRTDRILLRDSVAASLARLEAQNYTDRTGDIHMFLTDEEQDVASDISRTPVDTAAIVARIGENLLLTQCNSLHAMLPEIFGRMRDYTEMLLPNNILKADGIIGRLVSDIIPEDTWRDGVQIIGWLYQYYNTEPKQAVFDGLKSNVKITRENIPAATQLFTPDWIVRYMVENSLGRLWLESRPDSPLRAGWKYYVEEAPQPPQVEENLRIMRKENALRSPEEIRIIEIITSSLIQFDVSFLPETQKGARHIKRVQNAPLQNGIVKRYGVAPAMVDVKADLQGFINID